MPSCQLVMKVPNTNNKLRPTMKLQPKINVIALAVADLQRSTDFYSEVFGWQPSTDSNENITFLKLNGVLLSLYPKAKLAADATVQAAGEGFRGVTMAHIAASEAEVDDMFAHMASHNVTIVKPAEKAFWGGYSGYIADPDGHLWEIAYNPYMKQDEHGNVI